MLKATDLELKSLPKSGLWTAQSAVAWSDPENKYSSEFLHVICLTQAQAAKRLGTHKVSWNRWERGERSPSAALQAKLERMGV